MTKIKITIEDNEEFVKAIKILASHLEGVSLKIETEKK
jgi:hypothetical protein